MCTLLTQRLNDRLARSLLIDKMTPPHRSPTGLVICPLLSTLLSADRSCKTQMCRFLCSVARSICTCARTMSRVTSLMRKEVIAGPGCTFSCSSFTFRMLLAEVSLGYWAWD
jgi:hypothetical protein